MTTRHTQAQRAPWVATVHDVIKRWAGSYLALVLWVARTLSHCTPVKWGKISSNSSTHDTSQFGDSICPVRVSTSQMLVHSEPIDAGLYRHRQGLETWSSEFQIRPLPSLPIRYSPLSLNPVSTNANHLTILLNHIGPPLIERALSQVDSNHSSSTDSLHN
jgi:hypothetical protein